MTRRRQKDCAQSWSGFVETQGEGTRRMYTFSFISLSMLAYLVVPTVHIIAYLDSPVSQNPHLRPQVLFQIKSATMQIVVKWSTCRREHRHRPFSQFLDRRRGWGCARARKRGGRRRSGRRKSPRTLTPPLSRKQLFERGSEDDSRRIGTTGGRGRTTSATTTASSICAARFFIHHKSKVWTSWPCGN